MRGLKLLGGPFDGHRGIVENWAGEWPHTIHVSPCSRCSTPCDHAFHFRIAPKPGTIAYAFDDVDTGRVETATYVYEPIVDGMLERGTFVEQTFMEEVCA